MLLNVSFEKTISVEVEIPDDVSMDDLDGLVTAIQQSDAAEYVDSWLDDQPAIGYQIDDDCGRPLYKDIIFNLFD